MKKEHRIGNNGYEYRSIQTILSNKLYCYSVVTIENGKSKYILEIYQGENYIVGSKEKSYSKVYRLMDVPECYKSIVKVLEEEYNKTNWDLTPEGNLKQIKQTNKEPRT